MRNLVIAIVLLTLVSMSGTAMAFTLTYNELELVNLNDNGIPADERSTNDLIVSGDIVYGATSGDRCHIFRYNAVTGALDDLVQIDGPNTIMKGMVLDGSTLYVGTMLDRRQMYLEGRRRGGTYDELDALLYQMDDSWNTGHLYRITGVDGGNPVITDLGVPVPGQGIHTMAMDTKRGLIYGLTFPLGRFFIHDTKTGRTETVTFGTTYSTVSNHMVQNVEVVDDLTSYPPGNVEFNIKMVSRDMHIRDDGTVYMSGWQGQLVRYDPEASSTPSERFSVVGYLPSVPGRQYWNRVDEIIERDGILYVGSSDGYISRVDPRIGSIEAYGKPIRAIEVKGLAFSNLDGRLYGINGGDVDGISRFWSLDTDNGTYIIDYPALQIFNNRRSMADCVCTASGTLVMAETERVANLWVLKPGEPKEWEKSGVMSFDPQGGPSANLEQRDLYVNHKKVDVEVFPAPSSMHGGSGYTAIQADNDGRMYMGGAYYGKFSPLLQLEPDTAQWRLIFRSDELTGQFGRGQGVPGKIHTKLRLGDDGKIYGAMKQGYEFTYQIRADVGEAPEGEHGGQMTCHFFSYDPETDTALDLGPGLPQEGITSFETDTGYGYLYGVTVPGVRFLVYDLRSKRVYNAGAIAGSSPSRYMTKDLDTGKVYHRGEATPDGRYFMTVWDPDEYRLRDIEVVGDDGFEYRHSYAIVCGPPGSNKLYGDANGWVYEMDLNVKADGKLHVRPVCRTGVEGEVVPGRPYTFACGPDGRIYWAENHGDHGKLPISLFAWDPKTEKRTYLGTCALDGEWLQGGMCQGICFDNEGNMGMMILYARITPEQKKDWSVADDFEYQDIVEQPYYISYPGHYKDSYYSLFYLKDATSIR